MAPFEAGCGWFGRTLEKDAEGWYLRGPTSVNDGGLYLHLQPCVSDTVVFPGGHGLGWMCFRNSFDANETERDYDPAYLVIEGQAEQLGSTRELFLQAASGHHVMLDQVSLQAIFGNGPGFEIQIVVDPPALAASPAATPA